MNNPTSQQNLPGFEAYPTMKSGVIPDFQTLLAQRLTPSTHAMAPNRFDPHSSMIKKKQEGNGEIPVDTTSGPRWLEKDIKVLEDFCNKHNIKGFKCGMMPPLVALAMLKDKLGYTDLPLEDRVPDGYQKLGTPNEGSPSYPYSKAVDQRVILNG